MQLGTSDPTAAFNKLASSSSFFAEPDLSGTLGLYAAAEPVEVFLGAPASQSHLSGDAACAYCLRALHRWHCFCEDQFQVSQARQDQKVQSLFDFALFHTISQKPLRRRAHTYTQCERISLKGGFETKLALELEP